MQHIVDELSAYLDDYTGLLTLEQKEAIIDSTISHLIAATDIACCGNISKHTHQRGC